MKKLVSMVVVLVVIAVASVAFAKEKKSAAKEKIPQFIKFTVNCTDATRASMVNTEISALNQAQEWIRANYKKFRIN